MTAKIVSIAAMVSLAIVFTVLFLQIPWTAVSDALALLALSLVAVYLAYIFYRATSYSFPRTSFLWVGVPLFAALVLSMFFGASVRVVWGLPLSMGGFIATLAFLTALYAGLFLPASAIRMFVYSFVGAGLTAGAAFALFALQYLTMLSPRAWSNVAFALIATGLICATLADNSPWGRRRAFYAGSALLSALMFLLVRDTSLLLAGILSAMIVGGVMLFSRWPSRLGTAPTTVFAYLAVLLVIFGASLGPLIPQLSPRDAPPIGIALTTLRNELTLSPADMLLGAGTSFPSVWNNYRPITANSTQWWKGVPAEPNSDALLMLMQFGALGLYGFLLPPMLLILIFLRRRAANMLVDASFALALVAFASALVTDPSQLFLLCGAISAGSCASLAASERRDLRLHRHARSAALILLVGFSLLGLGTGLVASYAAMIEIKATVLAQSDPARASLAVYAAEIWPDPLYLVEAGNSTLNYELSRAQIARSLGQSPDQSALQAAVSFDGEVLDSAIEKNPKNVSTWMSRATFYLFLDTMGVDGARQKSADSLFQASQLAPMKPDVPFDRAIIAQKNGDTESAKQYLKEALRLKPDYQEARKMLESLGG